MLKKLKKNNLIKFCIIYVFFSNNPAYAQNASISLNTIENSKNNLFWFQENNNQGIKQDNWNFYGILGHSLWLNSGKFTKIIFQEQ